MSIYCFIALFSKIAFLNTALDFPIILYGQFASYDVSPKIP